MKPSDIPNLITVLRILLVAPVVYAMLSQRFSLALLLFVAAGVSDAVDGFLAKFFHWQSRLGSFLDPIADKLLLVSCFVAAGALSLLPVWLVVAVVVRDLVIVVGASVYYKLLGPFDGRPMLTSKLNTLVQLILMVVVLVDQGVTPVSPVLLQLLGIVTLSTTLASGVMYVYYWGQSYLRATRSSL